MQKNIEVLNCELLNERPRRLPDDWVARRVALFPKSCIGCEMGNLKRTALSTDRFGLHWSRFT